MSSTRATSMMADAGAVPDNDALIDLLRERDRFGTAGQGLRNWLMRVFDDEMRKACWMHNQTALRMDWPRRPTFELEYLDNLTTYFRCAAAVVSSGPAFEVGPRELVLAWHHPASPVLMSGIRKVGALALIAQRARWMIDLMGEENTLSFREPGSGIALLRAFRSGRPVACMIDFCYEESACVDGRFLGFPARTPVGVFALASRFGYRLRFVAFDGLTPVAAAALDAGGRAVEELAAWTNALLEERIAADPPAWLLWPSLDRRVEGIRFD